MTAQLSTYFGELQNVLAQLEIQDRRGARLSLSSLSTWHRTSLDRMRPPGANQVLLVGNGGSAAICTHIANDYIKNAKRKAMVFSDAALLTCMGNDFGYENIYSYPLAMHTNSGDLLIAISSSGQSENILNAVEVAQKRGAQVLTFSGFDSANPLRRLGDVNVYCPVSAYGLVELAHSVVLHGLVDALWEPRFAAEGLSPDEAELL